MRSILIVGVALMLMVGASPQPASAAGPAYHVVSYGETLFSIATRYGVSTWALARVNGLWNPNYIYAGQTLLIPGAMPPYPPVYYPGPYPGPFYGCTYRVQYGDTMLGIAARLRVDAWTLARSNGIYNLNWIYAGQWLRVPGCYR